MLFTITNMLSFWVLAHWVQLQSKKPWSARQGHAAAALNGSLFVFGGFDESGYCNTAYRLRLSAAARSGTKSLIIETFTQ